MFKIGDTIRHALSREEGRIARIVKTEEILSAEEFARRTDAVAYVAMLPGTEFGAAREVLWYESEVISESQASGSREDDDKVSLHRDSVLEFSP